MTLSPVSTLDGQEQSPAPGPALPEDRAGIQEFVRASVLEVAGKTAETLSDCPDPPPYTWLLEQYVTLAESWASKEAFWNGSFCDFIEFAAGAGEDDTPNDDREGDIDSLSSEITKLVSFQISPCPVANQADSGRELYTKYPQIADVCGFLKCPIIEAGETDFVVLTSINPYTAKFTADIVREVLSRDTGVMPFVFSTTCPVKVRDYLCARHFMYES